jgi:integrase/recombinase XerD
MYLFILKPVSRQEPEHKDHQSLITNLLKEGKDLLVVKTFADHKNLSSTEKYRQTGLEELKAAVLNHHPLG